MWSVSDEALVAGLASGDAEAATAFVRRFQGRVFGLALTMVGERAVAEEIAQETFLRAWRHAGAYDPRRSGVTTWLLAIARNLAIDHLRMKRAYPVDPAELGDREGAVWAALEGATAHGELVDLRDAVRALPAEQRRALLLAALFGYTAREIGAIEGAPVGTAKTRIRSALSKVRGALEEAER
jgi:RNA polymerase sigma-70 factor (ECF subfamily)